MEQTSKPLLQPVKIDITVGMITIPIFFAVAIVIFMLSNPFPGFGGVISGALRFLFLVSVGALALKLVIAFAKGPTRMKYLLGLATLGVITVVFISVVSSLEYTHLTGGI